MFLKFFKNFREELKDYRFRLLVIYFIVLMIVSVVVFGIQSSIPFLAWIFISIPSLIATKNNTVNYKRLLLVAGVYPLLEMFFKILTVSNLIPHSWDFINRMEHATFSGCATYLIIIALKESKTFTNHFIIGIFTFLLINFLGLINEFIEYFIRQYITNVHLNETQHIYKYSLYYADTIYDLLTNLIAAGVVSIATIYPMKKKQSEN